MMKLSYLILFCSFTVCVGCADQPKEENTLFTEKQSLVGDVLITDEALLDPDGLLITDSILVVCNQKDSFHLEAFRLSTCENLGRFLSRGSGPEEFIYLGTMQRGEDRRSFYVSDFGSHKLFRYEERDIVQGRPTPEPISLPPISRKIEGAQFSHYWYTPEGVLAQNITEKGRICLIKSDTAFFGGDYPHPEIIDKRLEEYPLANALVYQSRATLSPAADKVALICASADMLDVYSLHSNRIQTDWSYWHAYPNEMVVMPNGDQYLAGVSVRSIYHYIDICSSDRFIFALYSGKKREEPNYLTGSRIRVVSWDRTRSKELETPDQLRAISVSPDGNTLYGINQTEEGYEIKTYDLTTIF